jgi:DNA-binding response OmpR family regulator
LISVVDDDPEVLKFLEFVLKKAGYAVSAAATPGRFFDSILKSKPALCLIDVQLPGMDGREIVRVLRSSEETRDIPLVVMSAQAVSSTDKVRGLNDGADEYFAKPLDVDLLLVRIANLLARRGAAPAEAPGGEIVSWGPLRVLLDEHRATLGGKDVPLTHMEMKLLVAFLRQPGRVLPRALLLQSVWNAEGASTRTVDKHVETLRRKLPPFGKKVETVVGVGYLFRP